VEIIDGIIHGTLPRRAINLIYEWLDLHREELLENWKLISERKPVNNIDPLK